MDASTGSRAPATSSRFSQQKSISGRLDGGRTVKSGYLSVAPAPPSLHCALVVPSPEDHSSYQVASVTAPFPSCCPAGLGMVPGSPWASSVSAGCRNPAHTS